MEKLSSEYVEMAAKFDELLAIVTAPYLLNDGEEIGDSPYFEELREQASACFARIVTAIPEAEEWFKERGENVRLREEGFLLSCRSLGANPGKCHDDHMLDGITHSGYLLTLARIAFAEVKIARRLLGAPPPKLEL